MGYPIVHQGPRVTWSHMGDPMMVCDQYFIEKNTELMFKTSLLFEVARCSFLLITTPESGIESVLWSRK